MGQALQRNHVAGNEKQNCQKSVNVPKYGKWAGWVNVTPTGLHNLKRRKANVQTA
jgi:hypothetical protein